MIIEDHKERINDFYEFMAEKLSEIDAIKAGDALLYRKVLYISFLDSMAGCVFPNSGNRERFIRLIDRFSHWEERDRVCMLHLARFCTINSEPDLEKIREYSFSCIRKWQKDDTGTSIIEAKDNPKYSDIKNLWEKSGKEMGLAYQLSDFKLSSLMYQLRNALVHQFQSRGREFGPLLPDVPFYQFFKTIDLDGNLIPSRFELVYPSSFLSSICKTILQSIYEYLSKGNINPFPTYYAGDFWLRDLNK